MKRITRTLTLVEIEAPNGEKRCIAPSDIEAMKCGKVLGRKKVLAEMPLEVFVEHATIKEVK